MTDLSTPQHAEELTSPAGSGAPRVKVIIAHIEGADLVAALGTIERQVYGAVDSIEVVGGDELELPDHIERRHALVEAISNSGPGIEYLWLIHSDARPRPDALTALVKEVQRNDASLGGSKVLKAGTASELESIGSATDVFGEPFSGLDDGEIDLQQYDVVREVAFVSSVSMLIRRDLAQGLGGLDTRLTPGAAGQDLSQRVRLAGGKVLIVPSSEVYHQRKCGEREGWKEQAGRYRAMLKAYRTITLAWVIPFGLLVGLLSALASLLFLKWRPIGRYVAAVAWNLAYLPSTVLARRRFRKVRAVGDEELFRFQARGSIRLREVGSEFSDRLLFMFDEDHALARGTRRFWASPGIWGALLAGAIALFATRSFFFSGVPNAGFSFPFEAPSVALSRFLGGWNESGLGSASPVHPAVGLTGLASLLWFGQEDSARTLLTLAFAILGVVGLGRLSGRLGLRGPGRYLAGLVLLAGPGTALATGAGSWLALGGAAALPWAVRSVFRGEKETDGHAWSRFAWALLWSLLLASLSPLLGLVPLGVIMVWNAAGGRGSSLPLATASLLGLTVAASFLLGDPGWVLDAERRIGHSIGPLWPGLIVAASVPLLFFDRVRRFAFLGGFLALTGTFVVNLGDGGPGVEEAGLVLASFGSALLVAAGLDAFTARPLRVLASVSATVMLVLSIGYLGNGRLGLLAGDENSRFAFSSTLAGEGGPGRLLIVSADRSAIPGEARPGPGLWYRTLDGAGMTIDEVWLPPTAPGDEALANAIGSIASGAELRPGGLLSEYSIDWVVVVDDPAQFDQILSAQLDLTPKPLDSGSEVYENPSSLPMAFDSSERWGRSGTGFVGETATDRVRISMNSAPGWVPAGGPDDWAVTVSAEDGWARYRPTRSERVLPLAASGLFLASIAVMIVDRARR